METSTATQCRQQDLLARALSGDVDAQIEWLTSRRPDKWSNDPPEEEDNGN